MNDNKDLLNQVPQLTTGVYSIGHHSWPDNQTGFTLIKCWLSGPEQECSEFSKSDSFRMRLYLQFCALKIESPFSVACLNVVS